MKTIYEIDKDGYMTYSLPVEIYPIGVDDDFQPIYEIPEGYVDTPLPTDEDGIQLPFWRPKWDGEKWIEARPQAEIDEEKSKPIPPSPTEVLTKDVEAVAEMVSVVAEESFMIAETVAGVMEDSDAIAGMVAVVAEETYVIADSVTTVRGDAEAMAEMLASFALDVTSLIKEVVSVKAEVVSLRAELKTLKGE